MGHINKTHWYNTWGWGEHNVPLTEMGIHAVRYEGRGYPELYRAEEYDALKENHLKPKDWPTSLHFFGDDGDEMEVAAFKNALRDLENALLVGQIYSEGFQDGFDAAHRGDAS